MEHVKEGYKKGLSNHCDKNSHLFLGWSAVLLANILNGPTSSLSVRLHLITPLKHGFTVRITLLLLEYFMV
jgi:hypothetical protein